MSNAFSDFESDERNFLAFLGRDPASHNKPAIRCPEPRLLFAAREHVLPEAQRSAIEAHLDECADCRTLLVSTEEAQLPAVTSDQVERVRARIQKHLPPAPAISRRFSIQSPLVWRLAPALATLIIVGSLGVWYQQLHRIGTPPAEGPAAPPSQAVDPASLVFLEPAPVELPLDALLVRRDAGADAHTLYIRKLAEALAPYRKGDYTLAVAGLAQVASAYPKAPEVHFYYGVCLLFIDRAGEAVQLLSRGDLFSGTPWQRKASWYLGIAQLRTDNAAGALNEFQKLCLSEGERKESACEAVRNVSTVTRNPARR